MRWLSIRHGLLLSTCALTGVFNLPAPPSHRPSADLEESDTSSGSGSSWSGWSDGGSAGLMLGEVVEECPFLPAQQQQQSARAKQRRSGASSDVSAAWRLGFWTGGQAGEPAGVAAGQHAPHAAVLPPTGAG